MDRLDARQQLRIAARELMTHAGSDVDVTARELSDLADVCSEIALEEALGWADARFGVPKTSAGERCAFVVIGMGKLGGQELNYSSDIDLMFVYGADGETTGGPGGRLPNGEYFARVARDDGCVRGGVAIG